MNEHFTQGLAALGRNIVLESFAGISRGSKVRLHHTEGLGKHWRGRLQDEYAVAEIDTVSNGSPTNPDDINVIVESTRDGYRATLGIALFL